MTMLDTLFGLVPEASTGQQWLAEDLQLVNWGGYDGAHRVRFSPAATLLCGGSGSGKSTLMDAYIALMMPHTTPFNGASNGAVTGRPRGEEQRNILSYGRGKLDESRSGEGTQVRVLRGDGTDTWTAVAMTWADHSNSHVVQRFTAVRAWYFPATARVMEDAVKVRGVVDGPFDLAALQDAATHRLSDAAVRATGLDTMPTDKEFLARIHSVLGIGAAGAGTKAMSLLARIQAGQQITTVDELYKRMVLEEPETMAVADQVVSHFDELESTRERMVTAQRQVKGLRPIREYTSAIEASAEQLRLIEEIGTFDDADSLAALWMNGQRLDLLHTAEAEVRTQKKAVDAEVTAATVAAEAAEAERDGLLEVLRHSGGDQLDTAQREISQAERRLAEVSRARARFDEAVMPADLEEQVTTAEDFAALTEHARIALNDPNIKTAAMDAYADARATVSRLSASLKDLEAEHRQVTGRADNIPGELHAARDALATAAGLTRADLPFVGELVEVRTEYEPWREAFNQALGGFATTLLIDTANLADFRAAIDTVRTGRRIRFEGVHTGLQTTGHLDPARLPGRLDYRDSAFSGWLQQRLERQFDFVCVDSASELSGHSQALTITGQLSQGSRGAHGGHGARNVLGFSNQRRLADLDGDIAKLRAEIAAAAASRDSYAAELDALDARLAAYRAATAVTWEEIDVDAVTAERDRWAGIIDEITTGNPEIEKLQEQIDELKVTVDRQRESIGKARGEQDVLKTRWADIADQVDAAMIAVDEADEAGRELSDAQASYLSERFGPSDTPDQLTVFDAAIATAAGRLAEDRSTAQKTLTAQRDQLRRTLENFLDNWPNPNLRADPDTSVGDFERILDDLETSGLHELEAEWKNSLVTMSGNDLTNLASALSRARREIQERIEPINQIMRELPFYDDDHRLQISPRDNQSESRRKFLKDLRDVRGLIESSSTSPADSPERAQAYERMSRLINRIRRTAPDFDGLIDVRNHVRVSAEKIHATTGAHVALYDHIGEKSGGESQELIAFIVGAALRYQLGDASAERPRYAPVFLDEALIKADAHFTARAIGAWRGLGFQLVIGAPNDKYSAIEPHVQVEYDILKDTSGRSWAKPKVGV